MQLNVDLKSHEFRQNERRIVGKRDVTWSLWTPWLSATVNVYGEACV